MFKLSPKIILPAVAVVLVTAGALPSYAAGDAATPINAAATAQPSKRAIDPVETRIAQLHDKLQITEGQAGQWDNVARTMRSNAKAIEDLVATTHKNQMTMSAVDDLRAYQEIADAHARAARRMTTAFETLYATMSDDQKKLADAVFRQHKQDTLASSR